MHTKTLSAMWAHWRKLVLLPVLLIPVSCPPGTPASPLDELGRRPGNEGFMNDIFGPERRVALRAGNLAETEPATSQERVQALADFLGAYRAQFGGGEESAGALSFLPAVQEEALEMDGADHRAVIVHQEHEGALVLDALVYGDYVVSDTRASQLRSVYGRLFPPDSLPSPPDPDRVVLAQARDQFEAWLADRAVQEGDVSLLEVPVILGEQNMAGFLAVFTAPTPEGQPDLMLDTRQGRVAAVVNPLTATVFEINNIPACLAGRGVGE